MLKLERIEVSDWGVGLRVEGTHDSNVGVSESVWRKREDGIHH